MGIEGSVRGTAAWMRPPTTRRGIGLLRWRSVPESPPAGVSAPGRHHAGNGDLAGLHASLCRHRSDQIADIRHAFELVDQLYDAAGAIGAEYRLDQAARLLVDAVGIERILLGAGRKAREVHHHSPVAERYLD